MWMVGISRHKCRWWKTYTGQIIQNSWKTFWKIRNYLLSTNIQLNLLRWLFDTCILPLMALKHGPSVSWENLRVAQRVLERQMLVLTRDGIRNEESRKAGVKLSSWMLTSGVGLATLHDDRRKGEHFLNKSRYIRLLIPIQKSNSEDVKNNINTSRGRPHSLYLNKLIRLISVSK